MAKSAIIRGVLSKLRSSGTARSVGARTFQNVDDVLAMPIDPAAARAAALSGSLRSGAARDFSLEELAQLGRYEDEIVELRGVLAAQQKGGLNKQRIRMFRHAGETRQLAQATARAADRSVDRVNALNEQLSRSQDTLRQMQTELTRIARGRGDLVEVVTLPNGTKMQVSSQSRTVAKARLEQRIARQQEEIAKLADRSEKINRNITRRAERAEMLSRGADTSEALAKASPKRRAPNQERIAETQAKIDERQTLIDRLMSPTQGNFQDVLSQVPETVVPGAKAAGSGAAAGTKKQLGGGWKTGLAITGGIGGYMASQSFFGGLSEREENAQAGDRLQGMIAGAANQRLEMLRAMAAMQRIETGARQNLANLAMQQPHVFNEIMAGRQLAQGVVSVGGDRTAQMNRMAEVGAAMTTGQFNRMGSPDALGLLAQYMNQG